MHNLSPQLDAITAWRERHFLIKPLCVRARLRAGSAVTETSLCVVSGCFSFPACPLVLPGPTLFGWAMRGPAYLFWLLAFSSGVDDRIASRGVPGMTSGPSVSRKCFSVVSTFLLSLWAAQFDSGLPVPRCPCGAVFVRKAHVLRKGCEAMAGILTGVQHPWVWVSLFSKVNNNILRAFHI